MFNSQYLPLTDSTHSPALQCKVKDEDTILHFPWGQEWFKDLVSTPNPARFQYKRHLTWINKWGAWKIAPTTPNKEKKANKWIKSVKLYLEPTNKTIEIIHKNNIHLR